MFLIITALTALTCIDSFSWLITSHRIPTFKMVSEKSGWLPTPYKNMVIGVSKESAPGEKRVAMTPESAAMMIKAGFQVVIESNAGKSALFKNSDYEEVGAKVVGRGDTWKADIVVKVQPPTLNEVKRLENRTIISFIVPSENQQLLESLQKQRSTAFGMDCVPRLLARSQDFDALSSQVTNLKCLSMLWSKSSHPDGRLQLPVIGPFLKPILN